MFLTGIARFLCPAVKILHVSLITGVSYGCIADTFSPFIIGFGSIHCGLLISTRVIRLRRVNVALGTFEALML